MVLEGSVYQTRLAEIGRTLLQYEKADKSQGILVLWDAGFRKEAGSEESGDLAYLDTEGAKVAFFVNSEDDGQCVSAWPVSTKSAE